MMGYFEELKIIALTALFNPMFLALLLILFFAGKFFGKLTRKLNIWKILILAYFGLFLYTPVRDAGPILGGIFLLGIASNHVGTLFSIISWAGNLGDVVFAFRYKSAYIDIRRREQDLEEREQRLREAELRQAYQQQEQGQRARAGWQDEAKGFRQKAEEKKTGGSSKPQSGREKSNDKRSQRRYQTTGGQPQEGTREKHLRILGLKLGRNYSPDDVKQAYRKRARATHPDAGGSQVEFIEVVNAYEWLRNHPA